MSPSTIRIYFDFVDPLSYAVSHALEGHDAAKDLEWIGLELRPPPMPLTESTDPVWAERREKARAWGSAFRQPEGAPRLVPWTRKAHELYAFAGDRGVGRAIRVAVLEAYFDKRLDIGRVDVLVRLAAAAGLDGQESKAVLDVDRYGAEVEAARDAARALGVSDVPALAVDGRLLEVFPDPTGIGTLLPRS